MLCSLEEVEVDKKIRLSSGVDNNTFWGQFPITFGQTPKKITSSAFDVKYFSHISNVIYRLRWKPQIDDVGFLLEKLHLG